MDNRKFTLKKVFIHLKTIFKHKFWVLYYANMCGITWQGIIHDLSKFSPKEFFINVKFTIPGKSPIQIQKELYGYSSAWLHHKGHNPHHYEYWMDRFDDGCYVNKMPFKYIVESMCDYLAANKAYMGKESSFESEYNWWKKQKSITSMHPDNIVFLNSVFEILLKLEKQEKTINQMHRIILNKKELKKIYDIISRDTLFDYQYKIDNK